MHGIVFTLYLSASYLPANFQFHFYLHIERLWLDAAHRHSTVIRAKTSIGVGQGGIPAGRLDQSGWNRFIKWPGWLAVWDHCRWSIWQTVIFTACPAGTRTATWTHARLLPRPSKHPRSDRFVLQRGTKSGELKYWKLIRHGVKKKGAIQTDVTACQLPASLHSNNEAQ